MKKYLIYLVIIASVASLLYFKIFIPKHTYETTNAIVGDMSVTVSGIGNVGARDIYKVGSIYGGKVLSFSVVEGDFIKKGTLIAKIDSIDLKDKILEQEVGVKKLQKDITSLNLDKKAAEVQYEYQEEIYSKNQRLYKGKAISELDYKKFLKDMDLAKLLVENIDSKIDAAYTQIEQIKASTKGLKTKLSRYTIVAPIDGYITKKYISNFEIINPNQILIEIVNPKDVWIETHIDTRISGDVKIGSSVLIKLRSSNIKLTGKVINIKPVNNSVTNEREIDIGFDKLPIPFYMQEQAIIDINIKELKNIIKVPLVALSIYKEKNGVWIQRKNKVEFKELEILAYSDKFGATKDISIEDKLVIPNPNKKALTNGMKIYND
ncbi:MAG: efflux RND transporter periplasmic adaptor subunit [Sulfurimonas sp.]|nr:efflux RND transporter periplasmic adaptor subunit [Sulfurimonas sp.]